ncbi:hypothetical protein PUNSTDRAFT_86034 [Punctularia strigosozonata HHB-11173 SS5]|uniref:uncharacterized protein n=1 Tax=Punctularia strigosozonata (strain HHB-11173) TaxID=741275 RepID=UPI0004417056|nr:uncharacterized protein PUNSTDRAFT_86034 [Punctularia strigosozonata HHB-11173 SS5]EIN09598.1 hypothetical protein PUNSTDRAFT_86034 [Punctularia strigosozonata HHB-11173 SS5]
MPSATYGSSKDHESILARPDRPLVVKCTFDKWNKRISFSSARNCSYHLLRSKVEQCFSLHASTYAIAYKDDDGEITDITTETDLTEAIQYFQAGNDDAPLSSAASILSGRSFGSRKITLRIQITVDYDGPSLSDTGSLVSLEEYRERRQNGSELSFSLNGSIPGEPEDDAVTVSSRDAAALAQSHAKPTKALSSNWDEESARQPTSARHTNGVNEGYAGSDVALRYSADPSAVFERLRLAEEEESERSYYDRRLSRDDRGLAWLREQTSRILNPIGLPAPSISDDASISLSEDTGVDNVSGDLALEQDPRGRYYYSYTSASSSAPSQVNGHYQDQDDASSISFDPVTSRPVVNSSNSEPIAFKGYGQIHPDTPPEVLEFLRGPVPSPPESQLTDCSECGMLLEAIRYICATCGEKEPRASHSHVGKGKDKLDNPFADPISQDVLSYPPSGHRTYMSPSSSPSSSRTYLGDATSQRPLHVATSYEDLARKPLPSLPHPPHSPLLPHSGSSSGSTSTLAVPTTARNGYELCSLCIETAGVTHALETTVAPGTSPHGSSSPSSPEEALRAMSQWTRSAPKQKGQLRHGYLEKVWGSKGWEPVEHDDGRTCKCSTCNSVILNKRYKCASCQKFNLCRACYSQVHEIHPSHAFLVVTDKPARSRSEPDMHPPLAVDHSSEQSLVHPGVKCMHCMLDIVGARFHCAVCPDIDICSNCESAGVAGNLDSSDGGHNSSHIMIKIPYPLETSQVESVSRRAVDLWTGRDAAAMGGQRPRSRANSLESGYARTVVGSGSGTRSDTSSHHPAILCDGCNQTIHGTRYQCASCPSLPKAFNLCSTCELRSYAHHDPMHVFVKIPRPIDRPLELARPLLPRLYKNPVGPANGVINHSNPKLYLRSIVHNAALCDRCMTHIQGEWFRCAYCAKDLCDACEALDTHDDTHVFIVFKAPVDMQQLRQFVDLDNPNGSPPLIPYPLYHA